MRIVLIGVFVFLSCFFVRFLVFELLSILYFFYRTQQKVEDKKIWAGSFALPLRLQAPDALGLTTLSDQVSVNGIFRKATFRCFPFTLRLSPGHC